MTIDLTPVDAQLKVIEQETERVIVNLRVSFASFVANAQFFRDQAAQARGNPELETELLSKATRLDATRERLVAKLVQPPTVFETAKARKELNEALNPIRARR
jgi:hypothetical protein